jgi:succinylarginine dihydrolase
VIAETEGTSPRECNFDGLVGPTHGHGGLSQGNLASTAHAGKMGNPRAAALQGLEKMRFIASLGVPQAVLPPHPRPALSELVRLGFVGTPNEVLARAHAEAPGLLARVSSASAMWTANAATVVPSSDTRDGRLHLLVANLSAMPHRSIEAPVTERIFEALFQSAEHFAVHPPLPFYLGDEGAANHLRLSSAESAVHLFGWGRSVTRQAAYRPVRFVARQSLEASQAVARRCLVGEDSAVFWRQHPSGIDAGAFHSDVLAVGNENVLLLHELAFAHHEKLLATLRAKLGSELTVCFASDQELPVADAVASYPFNSQLVSTGPGQMVIVAPREAEQNPRASAFLSRAVDEVEPIKRCYFMDLNESMNNGGGPACLRLRVPLTETERKAIFARVFLDDALYADLKAWIENHYRDRIVADDLADPSLFDESQTALDELTRVMKLGSVFDFQR